MKISKELIKAVLAEKLSEMYVTIKDKPYMDKSELVFATRSGCSCEGADQTINVYEFAHKKCKEWIEEQGYIVAISSSLKHVRIAIYIDDDVKYDTYSTKVTKEEAIFKACNWLLGGTE